VQAVDRLPCVGGTSRVHNGPTHVSKVSGIRNGPASGCTHMLDVWALDIPIKKPSPRVSNPT
jgi:hypothetical protein